MSITAWNEDQYERIQRAAEYLERKERVRMERASRIDCTIMVLLLVILAVMSYWAGVIGW